ncbi:hypothetical protein SLS62_009546 [Diatrype stigma]|uniref:Uncharacterized protein n=1 Tax=Diatrype stigma TaxID=117547 RepID=A0AAN9UFP6_9PEZI
MAGDADEHRSRPGSAAAANTAESAPLLGGEARPPRPDHRPSSASHRASHSVASLPKGVHVPKVHKGSTIVNFLSVIILVSTSAGGFIDTPMVRLLEDTFCRDYYYADPAFPRPGGPIDEKLCKVDSIQTQVQDVLSIMVMLMSIVGLFSALPWGLAADRFGRRPIVFIDLVGIVIGTLIQMAVLRFHDVFPVRLIWLSAAGVAVGGGTPVLLAITFSIVTDATAEKDRFVRQEAVEEELESLSLMARIRHSFSRFKESLSLLQSVPLLLLMLATLVAMPIPYATLFFMVQYLSKRYGIKLSQTGYVQSVYGTLQLIQAFVILPWVSKVLLSSATSGKTSPGGEHHREHHLEHRRDLTLLRSSGVFLVVGFLILGLASTLPGFVFGLIVLALGSAYNSITRSIMSLYVDPEHTSRLFTLVGMVEVFGNAYGPPLIARLFDLGLSPQRNG